MKKILCDALTYFLALFFLGMVSYHIISVTEVLEDVHEVYGYWKVILYITLLFSGIFAVGLLIVSFCASHRQLGKENLEKRKETHKIKGQKKTKHKK